MYIGIDVGGTNIGAGIIDINGHIASQEIIHTGAERPFEEVCHDIISLIKKILVKANMKISQIESIGLGLPGVVNSKEGIFQWAPHLNVNNLNVVEVFEKEFNIKTYIENDAKCAAIAEATFGATKDYDNSITITIGTGIGTGVIFNKKIVEGFHNTAGEIGHMVINMDGVQCQCGRKGCWEQYASVSALRRMAKNEAIYNPDSMINVIAGWDVENISGRMVWQAADKGDKRAQKLIEEYIRYISEGITNIINVLDVEVVAIGGGVSRQGHKLIGPIQKFVDENALCHGREPVRIVTAKFGREAGAIGAAVLGLNRG